MFKKSVVVGVSITPEAGLEVAQIDYASKMILKYGRKPIDYNIVRREIADLDLFKESLQDLLEELEIPKGAEIVISIPTVLFKVTDYPASMDAMQIENAIEDELYDNQYLRDTDPCVSYSIVEKSLQFNKVAFTAVQRSAIIEIMLSLKDNGYNIRIVDTSVNSVLNSLIYLKRVSTEPGKNWVLLIVENSCCRILSISDRHYLDIMEEKISIGEVLSDAENYSTVINAVEPILKQLPSSYLCVVSKTNVISAEILSNKLTYSAPIFYQEANSFRKEDLLLASPELEDADLQTLTLDVIGACIYPEYAKTSPMMFNFFNRTLGDLYLQEQPPELFDGKLVLSTDKLIMFFLIIMLVLGLIFGSIFFWYKMETNKMKSNIEDMNAEIQQIEAYIAAHKDITTDDFDEGEEIRKGLASNKNVYSYYTIVGTEIPQKLWLTHLNLGDKTTIEGQADNIESVYAFFRNIKDYSPDSDVSLQKLGLATSGVPNMKELDTESILTMLDADFYEFCISNDSNAGNSKSKSGGLPGELELIN